MTSWFLALLSRSRLLLHARRLARKYRDLMPGSEIESALDLGISLAVSKYDPAKGQFLPFARPFVERVLMRTIRRELSWRKMNACCDPEEAVVGEEQTEMATWRHELQDVLGSDYDTFMHHHAWGASMRELGRDEDRSFRSIRETITRAEARVLRHYGHQMVPSISRARPSRRASPNSRGPSRPPKSLP